MSESPKSVTIYHNPDCGTSRNTLALIRNAGIEPTIIEYLKTPPSRDTLVKLLKRMAMTPRQLLREKGTPFAELKLHEAYWTPLSIGSVRPTQGKTLAVMEVSGGSQSFNAVNQLRVLGRWMRMITIPNQSSVARAFQEFDEAGRMKPSSYYERVVDVMEELVKFTLLTRDVAPYLVDRYSERRESAEELSKRVNLRSI